MLQDTCSHTWREEHQQLLGYAQSQVGGELLWGNCRHCPFSYHGVPPVSPPSVDILLFSVIVPSGINQPFSHPSDIISLVILLDITPSVIIPSGITPSVITPDLKSLFHQSFHLSCFHWTLSHLVIILWIMILLVISPSVVQPVVISLGIIPSDIISCFQTSFYQTVFSWSSPLTSVFSWSSSLTSSHVFRHHSVGQYSVKHPIRHPVQHSLILVKA